jgi:energy-coupling factor transporter transmembrane protein EcfT
MEQLKSAFSLEIKKESLQERVKVTLITACFLALIFAVLVLFFGNQKTYLARLLSLWPFFLLLLVFLIFRLLGFKNTLYKIQVLPDGIRLNGLQWNREVVHHLNYSDLSVQVCERVDHRVKLTAFSMVFSDSHKKYELNKNGEWTFSEIHNIITELEHMRKIYSFSIDGFHFKKDIEDRMKKDQN